MYKSNEETLGGTEVNEGGESGRQGASEEGSGVKEGRKGRRKGQVREEVE